MVQKNVLFLKNKSTLFFYNDPGFKNPVTEFQGPVAVAPNTRERSFYDDVVALAEDVAVVA